MPSFIKRPAEGEIPNVKRKNGLQRPWHYFQIASWVLFFFFSITAFGFILPLLPYSWQSTSYGILGIFFSGYFLFHLLTISIDTSSVDPNVPVSFMDAKKTKPEKMHCHIIPVTFYKERAKFCHACEKLVFNFDHHSRIFNTCLGGRNFWFYMNCIVTAFLGTMCLAIMSLFVFSTYLHLPWGKTGWSNKWLMSFSNTDPEILVVVTLLISFTDGAFCLLIASVLGYHICFHLYLLIQGLTTQEYYESLKKNLPTNNMRSRDCESTCPCRDVSCHSIVLVTKKSQLCLCDTAIQTEQITMENATQTNEEERFPQETESQTENKTEATQSSSIVTCLVERLEVPAKVSTKASAKCTTNGNDTGNEP